MSDSRVNGDSRESRDSSDIVQHAFDTIRTAAKKRNGFAPNLNQQGRSVIPRRAVGRLTDGTADEPTVTVPGLDLGQDQVGVDKRQYRGPGRMSGPDGRAPRRSYVVAGFSDLLKQEVRHRDWAKPLAMGWIMGSWEEVVGEKVAQHTKVEMVKDATLFISTDTTSWATQLRYMKRQILERLDEKIGEGIITNVHVYPPKTKSWRYGPLHVKGRGPRDTYG
ncbi:DciA family protein [Corynebacterium cystitidis]|uniref:DciA family protein n=1 Tax=Corynebacterium cystitidis TaxID=35757 RepID=UPI00211DBA67|nr:DciA family protein [Corynebacterium cystitidis]